MENTVRTQILELGDFTFESGETLPGIRLAYETYGTLNERKDNALLLFHALTGSHHAHGYNDDLPEAGSFWRPENFEGWWNLMIGPGKPLDTDKYFIICINYLGSCYGSSGPADTAPDGEPWGSRFPMVNANDQARAQIKVLDHFGIDRFYMVRPDTAVMLAPSGSTASGASLPLGTLMSALASTPLGRSSAAVEMLVGPKSFTVAPAASALAKAAASPPSGSAASISACSFSAASWSALPARCFFKSTSARSFAAS